MQHDTQFHNLTLSPVQTDSAGAERVYRTWRWVGITHPLVDSTYMTVSPYNLKSLCLVLSWCIEESI